MCSCWSQRTSALLARQRSHRDPWPSDNLSGAPAMWNYGHRSRPYTYGEGGALRHVLIVLPGENHVWLSRPRPWRQPVPSQLPACVVRRGNLLGLAARIVAEERKHRVALGGFLCGGRSADAAVLERPSGRPRDRWVFGPNCHGPSSSCRIVSLFFKKIILK